MSAPLRRITVGATLATVLLSATVLSALPATVPTAEAAGPVGALTDTTPWAGNSANTLGGKDYFVDATSGLDSRTGTTPAAAWKTLAKVTATTFQPGDRVLLKGGETWSGQFVAPKGSGTAARPIVLDAYGDESKALPYIEAKGKTPSPFTSGTTKNTNTVGLTGAVSLRNQEYWRIGHLQVSNDDNLTTNITTGAVVRDGISVSINADLFPAGANTIMRGITIKNVYAHDIDGPSTWQKIYLAGINFQIFGSKQWSSYAAGGHHFEDITIRDNSFNNVELNAVQFGFNWWGDSAGQTDEAGKYHEGWEQLWIRTRDLYNRNVYIGHNYAKNTGQGAFQFAGTKNLTAEYNEANGWLQRYNQVSAGLYLWAGSDSVMRFNEIYGGPANQYDATAWDLEFTNFNVTYEFNYSHDNQGGWMAYMGNSSNSIARYNLSVNDNGVIWKNMLSTNYKPTYVLNNVFVYDGAELEYFHDEVLRDRVYFANNVFYNTNATRTTSWYGRAGALDKGVFSNNAYYESSGIRSAQQPNDAAAVTANPKFVGNPADYARNGGVDNIRRSASLFALQAGSPLIDTGRYNPRLGTQDFSGTGVYWGSAPDIGLNEVPQGTQVTNPVDTNPIENTGIETRTDLAVGATATASSTHPTNNYGYKAAQLVDGNDATRWAAADNATYPLTVDIDFGRQVSFDEVVLQEFLDSGTQARVKTFNLQQWNSTNSTWVTFATVTDGIGSSRSVKGFGTVTSGKLRLSIVDKLSGQVYSPTMTEIKVFKNA